MDELSSWIDNNISLIEKTALYHRYFSGIQLEFIEDDYALENLPMGIDAVFNDKKVLTSIHLYAEGFQAASGFKDPLPNGSSFSDSRDIIHTKMGQPDVWGGGYEDNIFGYIEAWDKYFHSTFSLHFKYSKDLMSTVLITISSLSFESNLLAD